MEFQFKWKLVIEQSAKIRSFTKLEKHPSCIFSTQYPLILQCPFHSLLHFLKAGSAEMQAEALTGVVHIAHGPRVLSEASGCTRGVQCHRKMQLREDGCILVKVDLAFAFFFKGNEQI